MNIISGGISGISQRPQVSGSAQSPSVHSQGILGVLRKQNEEKKKEQERVRLMMQKKKEALLQAGGVTDAKKEAQERLRKEIQKDRYTDQQDRVRIADRRAIDQLVKDMEPKKEERKSSPVTVTKIQ